MKDVQEELEGIRSAYSFWARLGLYDLGAFVTFLGREGLIRRRCVEQLRLPPGGRVVDVACGTGKNHPYLVEAVGEEGRVIGVDITPEMLARAKERARRHGWSNVTLLQGDAAEIDLAPKGFDGVIGVLGFSVIPDHRKAIRKAVGLLKEGGRIVICDAVPFQGLPKILNMAVVPLYRRLARWDPEKDLLGSMEQYVQVVDLQWFNLKSIFIATGVSSSTG